jgi:hypothetical protein
MECNSLEEKPNLRVSTNFTLLYLIYYFYHMPYEIVILKKEFILKNKHYLHI